MKITEENLEKFESHQIELKDVCISIIGGMSSGLRKKKEEYEKKLKKVKEKLEKDRRRLIKEIKKSGLVTQVIGEITVIERLMGFVDKLNYNEAKPDCESLIHTAAVLGPRFKKIDDLIYKDVKI